VELSDSVDVLLLDEFGRLEALYGSADLAMVGGGWIENGGHNPLEAAQYGVPVLVGPDMSNFRESSQFLEELGLLTRGETVEEVRSSVEKILSGTDPEDRAERESTLRRRISPIRERYVEALNSSLEQRTEDSV
jgi:3-deoxy-D-manno-octulosonic-acid transferase